MTPLHRLLNPKIIADINSALLNAERLHHALRVYFEAERIRRMNLDANVALEDIVDAMLERCGRRALDIEINTSEAAEALGASVIVH